MTWHIAVLVVAAGSAAIVLLDRRGVVTLALGGWLLVAASVTLAVSVLRRFG